MTERLAALVCAAILCGRQPLPAQDITVINVFVAELKEESGRITVGQPANLTRSNGRNSQPAFTPDGASLLYSVDRREHGGQTEVYRHDLATGSETRVTSTAENENSPTPEPDGRTFVAVRWKPETLFRELGPWVYGMDGAPVRTLLPGPDTVGYFMRIDDGTFALVRPTVRFTVALHDLRTGETTDVDGPVAALPPQKVPGQRAVSYVVTELSGNNQIRKVDAATRATSLVAPTVPARLNHAWTPAGTLLMAKGGTIFARRPGRDTAWHAVASFDAPELRDISVYAVSPRGDRVVLLSPLKPGIGTVLRDQVQAAGVERAVEHIRGIVAAGRLDEYDLSETGVSRVGSEFLRQGRLAEAVAVFTLQTELFPRSYGAHASLGDALRAQGNAAAAAEHYRQALSLNPRETEAQKADYARIEAALREVAGGA